MAPTPAPRARRVQLLGEVGGGHPVGVPGGPLHELDPVAVGVDDPRRPQVVGAPRRWRRVDVDALGGERGDRGVQGVDLDDEVAQAGVGAVSS